MSEKIRIRKATKEDFEQLRDLKRDFYFYEAEKDHRINIDWAYNSLPAQLGKNLISKKVIFFVAERNKELIGYAGAQIEKTPPFMKLKKRAHLFNLYVKKTYRNKGIGKKLIAEVVRWVKSKKIKQMMIMTYSWNKNAKKLYNRLGFDDYIVMMVNNT